MAKKDEVTQGSVINTDRYISTKEAVLILEELIKLQRPVMMWGQPGIGKSDIVHQLGEKTGRRVIDIRLILMDPTDLRGMPYYSREDNKMRWAPSEDLPTAKDDNSIIFLDEISAADPSQQKAALQLVLNRRIGSYRLPEGVSMIAAGNRASDKTSANKMVSALANRFVHLNIEFNFDAWKEWAFGNNIHPHVIGYLSANPQDANTFNPKNNYQVFASPRTWSFVSQLLGSALSEDLLMDAISGTVGEGVAMKFASHRKYATKLPNPDDVLSGKVDKLDSDAKDIAIQHSLSVSLIYRLHQMFQTVDREDGKAGKKLTKKEWYGLADNFVKFVDNNFEPEIAMMAVSTCYKEPFRLQFTNTEMPSHKAFFQRNAKLFRGINTV